MIKDEQLFMPYEQLFMAFYKYKHNFTILYLSPKYKDTCPSTQTPSSFIEL